MHCGKKELCHLAQTLCLGESRVVIGESQIWGSLKIVIFFGGSETRCIKYGKLPLPSVTL